MVGMRSVGEGVGTLQVWGFKPASVWLWGGRGEQPGGTFKSETPPFLVPRGQGRRDSHLDQQRRALAWVLGELERKMLL